MPELVMVVTVITVLPFRQFLTPPVSMPFAVPPHVEGESLCPTESGRAL